jgi:hypothetical protein
MGDDTHKKLRPADQEPGGRVVADGRGRNVWQWSDTQLDSTSIVLKRLDNPALELEPTRRIAAPKRSGHCAGVPSRRRPDQAILDESVDYTPAGGFDPYNRS